MEEKKKTAQFIPMTSTQAAIGGGALIGTFALWFLWAVVGDAVMCWIETHPGMASWVQAIGSIAAIIATALGTRWQILKSKYIQEENEKKNNIHMSEACLEMCNAVISIMGTKETSVGLNSKIYKAISFQKTITHDFKSLERLNDLQETLRLILMKSLPLDLMKSLFQLQKIVVQYKEFINGFNPNRGISFLENDVSFLKNHHKKIKIELNKEIQRIVKYKDSL